MSELAADFIRDSAGIWWLIGVKAFKLENSYAKPTFKNFIPSHDIFISEEDDES